MNRIIIISLLCLLFNVSPAQQGWRSGEMEIEVYPGNRQEADILRLLKVSAEIASPDGSVIRAYVIPGELDHIITAGLKYKIIISDLNQHYQNFWTDQMVPPGYYTYEEIVAIADSLASAFPSICKKVMFGTSIYGRELAALKISDSVHLDEPEPEIMFDGGIHGDEIGGAENLIRYARDLCLEYGTDTTITTLINSREIWIY